MKIETKYHPELEGFILFHGAIEEVKIIKVIITVEPTEEDCAGDIDIEYLVDILWSDDRKSVKEQDFHLTKEALVNSLIGEYDAREALRNQVPERAASE